VPTNCNKSSILDWIERLILSSEEFFIPLKRLSLEIPPELADPPPPPATLRDWLASDARFEILTAADGAGGDRDAESAEEEAEMEKLGYFNGPRVGLKSKRPSHEQVLEIIQKHAGRLIESLQKAYEARPRGAEGAEEIEDQLLELMQRAKTLKKQLPGVGGGQSQ